MKNTAEELLSRLQKAVSCLETPPQKMLLTPKEIVKVASLLGGQEIEIVDGRLLISGVDQAKTELVTECSTTGEVLSYREYRTLGIKDLRGLIWDFLEKDYPDVSVIMEEDGSSYYPWSVTFFAISPSFDEKVLKFSKRLEIKTKIRGYLNQKGFDTVNRVSVNLVSSQEFKEIVFDRDESDFA